MIGMGTEGLEMMDKEVRGGCDRYGGGMVGTDYKVVREKV